MPFYYFCHSHVHKTFEQNIAKCRSTDFVNSAKKTSTDIYVTQMWFGRDMEIYQRLSVNCGRVHALEGSLEFDKNIHFMSARAWKYLHEGPRITSFWGWEYCYLIGW